MTKFGKHLFLGLLLIFLFSSETQAQRIRKVKTPSISSQLYSSLKYREIGPFRGGRSAAVVGVPGQPQLFYMGSAGGGVWRTTDGGKPMRIYPMAILVEVLVLLL